MTLRRSLILCVGLLACVDQSQHGGPGAMPTADDGTHVQVGGLSCMDEDGDGFGVRCEAGNDCDDADPSKSDECYVRECLGDEPGCPCDQEGARVNCGKIHSMVGNTPTCGYGSMVCTSGTWGECILGPRLETLGLGSTPEGCPTNPCDADCHHFPDTPDATLSSPTVVASASGLELVSVAGGAGGGTWTQAVNGPMPASVQNTLTAAGTMPGSTYYYHELTPGQLSAPEPFNLTASVQYIDVYFLLDTSATMGEALTALGNAMGGGTGVVAQVHSAFPTARFGVGHFHGYQTPPHDTNPLPKAVSPLWHTLNLQTDAPPAQNVMLWLGASGTTSNENSTEGFAVALYAEATSGGLYRGPGTYWVNPRNGANALSWLSDYAGVAPPAAAAGTGPCPNPAVAGQAGQGIAYPCFAPGARPITVVMTDNPGENGPGGQFALGHGSPEVTGSNTGGIPGATVWSAATAANNNGTEANAITIDPTVFSRHRGHWGTNGSSFSGRLRADADSPDGATYTVKGWDATTTHFPTQSQGDCASADGQGGREAFFQFNLTKRTYVHFDTWGSNADTVLYVVDKATRSRVACRDNVGWINSGTLNGIDTLMNPQANLNGYLAAGNYLLVVDQLRDSTCPPGYSSGGNGHCYKHSGATTATWNAARTACQADGGDLASVETNAENTLISGLFAAMAANPTQIGGKLTSGSWKWADGTAYAWTNWSAGEPSTAGSCMRRNTNGTWVAEACGSGSYRYVCEYAPGGDEYFLQTNAMADGNPVTAPAWQQTIAAHNAIGGKIIGIDVSGMGPLNATGTAFLTCDAPDNEVDHAWDRWTYLHLQEAARATGSIDSTDANIWTNPFVFSMNSKGGPCHAGDPSIGAQVVSAITDLTATLREDVSVQARDVDDGNDFDYAGAPGATPQLTNYDLNEGPNGAHPYGQFIDSVVAVPGFTNGVNGSGDPAPGGVGTRCNDNPATTAVIEQCLPDTVVRFTVGFGVPASFPLTNAAQIFNFDVAVMGSGTGVLGSQPAVIVVPPQGGPTYTDGWFERTYDASGVCGAGRSVIWGHWFWNATTASDSHVDFSVRTAADAAGLTTASDVALEFSNPPGPAALVGTAASARAAPVDTQLGAAVVDTALGLAGEQRSLNFLRVRSHLVASTDQHSTPLLSAWDLEMTCIDYE